jgi:hypothetical protein
MKEILSYRARGLLCRQQAVLHPETSWKWLAEAERWEHLADAEIASRFKESNTTSSNNPIKLRPTPDAYDRPKRDGKQRSIAFRKRAA